MLVKLLALVAVAAAIPAALWLGDALPLPEGGVEPDAAAAADDGVNEVEFTSRVEAICKWETRRFRGLRKLMKNVYTPDHLEALVQSIDEIGQESAGVFERIDAPRGLEEEADRLLRLLEMENRYTARMRSAAQHRDYRALVEAARRLAVVAGRVGPVMRDLGVSDCDPTRRAGISEGDIIEA